MEPLTAEFFTQSPELGGISKDHQSSAQIPQQSHVVQMLLELVAGTILWGPGRCPAPSEEESDAQPDPPQTAPAVPWVLPLLPESGG